MRIPVIRGVIDRRVLVNFRVDPEVLSRLLPSPFRPQIVRGYGIAGICLIRLKHMRPRFLPSLVGVSSENAAHRVAVEWDVDAQPRTGVFIPRRDTSSLLNAYAGGRIFPGVTHLAHFEVRETASHYRIAVDSLDRSTHVSVDGEATSELSPNSLFNSIEEASQFFAAGSLGYSPDTSNARFDGLELRAHRWHVEPLSIDHVESSFFDDPTVFPTGSAAFDNALLMQNIDHEWHRRESLCCDGR